MRRSCSRDLRWQSRLREHIQPMTERLLWKTREILLVVFMAQMHDIPKVNVSCYTPSLSTCLPFVKPTKLQWVFKALFRFVYQIRSLGQTVRTIICRWSDLICVSRHHQPIWMGCFNNDIGVINYIATVTLDLTSLLCVTFVSDSKDTCNPQSALQLHDWCAATTK